LEQLQCDRLIHSKLAQRILSERHHQQVMHHQLLSTHFRYQSLE
jgi:hypothetical protein